MGVDNDEMANVKETIGGDIRRHVRRRVGQRTWKDSNANTLFLY